MNSQAAALPFSLRLRLGAATVQAARVPSAESFHGLTASSVAPPLLSLEFLVNCPCFRHGTTATALGCAVAEFDNRSHGAPFRPEPEVTGTHISVLARPGFASQPLIQEPPDGFEGDRVPKSSPT